MQAFCKPVSAAVRDLIDFITADQVIDFQGLHGGRNLFRHEEFYFDLHTC